MPRLLPAHPDGTGPHPRNRLPRKIAPLDQALRSRKPKPAPQTAEITPELSDSGYKRDGNRQVTFDSSSVPGPQHSYGYTARSTSCALPRPTVLGHAGTHSHQAHSSVIAPLTT